MSESMSSPWIYDYLVDVAETYGAQVYNAPISKASKRAQLTDFLTYQENSYLWAWISDKDYRVPVRISKNAVDEYKRKHERSITECRFSLVFISNYRPLFSPRPLGPNVLGNTSTGGHLFGNPRDLEADGKMKEWILGLRQDGGGGNILKLRKQQESGQNQNASPSPPPLSLYAPVSQGQIIKSAQDAPNPRPERPQDLRRAYTKRWRKIEVDPWKLATMPAREEQPRLATTGRPLVEPPADIASQLESCNREPLARSTSPNRTASPSCLPQQGTPTNWSPSNRGSPIAPDDADLIPSINRSHDESNVLPTLCPPSDTEGPGTVNTTIISEACSPQPPTPAQRTKYSALPSSSPPPCSSPVFPHSPISSARQLPRSSPPPSLSLPPPSSSLSIPIGIRKNFQRKVPHPGPPAPRLDPAHQGPARVLVPNSDTSGVGSSQSNTQSQQCQPRSLAHLPTPPSHPSKMHKPANASTLGEGRPDDLTGHESKMFAGSLPARSDIGEQETALSGGKHSTEIAHANTGNQERTDFIRLPSQSVPKAEVLEVGTSDTEEEIEVQLTCNTACIEARLGARTSTRDTCERNANAGLGGSQLSIDDADVHSTLASIIPHPSPTKPDTNKALPQSSTETSERPTSQSSMHSLFSESLEDGWTTPSQAPILPIGPKEDKAQEKINTARSLRHDSEAWKEPSFISKYKGKGKARAIEESDTPSLKVGKKRWQPTHAESPVHKRAKTSLPGGATSDQMTTRILHQTQHQDASASTLGKTLSNNRLSMDTSEIAMPSNAFQSPKPRLVRFAVDFGKIDLGKGVPIPRLDLDKDIKSTLLRTGRIRTLGKQVENDGSVYIHL